MTNAASTSRTGLEILQAMFSGALPRPPISATLNFVVTDAKDDEVVAEGFSDASMDGPFGFIHGGFICTLLDTALTCAVLSTLPAGFICTTDLHVRHIRALPADAERLRAVATIVHRGRQVATSEGKLIDDCGRVYATATMACFVFAAKGACGRFWLKPRRRLMKQSRRRARRLSNDPIHRRRHFARPQKSCARREGRRRKA